MAQTLGEFLKIAREQRKISLEEVSFQTKIRYHYLKAIESNDFSSLPSRVQIKGFLRIYADYLDLSESVVLSALENEGYFIPEEKEEKLAPIDPVETGQEKEDHLSAFYSEPEREAQEEPQVQVIHNQPETRYSAQPVEEVQSEAQKIFIEIGEKLRQQRNILNLSIADIERFTNIRSHYLQALEDGNMSALPSMVQGRGMLSNYASFLNLNADEILLQFAEGLQTKRNEQYAPEMTGNGKKQRASNPPVPAPVVWRRFISPELIVTGALIVALFGFVLWGAVNVIGNQTTDLPAEPPSISDVLLNGYDPTSSTTTPTVPPNELAGEQTITENGLDNETTPTIPPAGNLPIQVYIIANQRAYLRVTSDDSVVFNGRILPGNAYEYSASESIQILTGNAAALDVYFNQEPIGILGGSGEVVSMVFNLEQGVITPTPRFSPTPTETSAPTATATATASPTSAPPTPTPTVTPFIP